ncbi:MAG: TlpA family protein disulfide reductase [Methanobacteriota archaeon]
MRRVGLVLSALSVLSALAVSGCLADDDVAGPAAPPEGTAVGARAPSFSLVDIDGNNVSSSALAGTVVLVDMMGANCPPCRLQMKEFTKLWARYENDTNFTMLSVDLGRMIGGLGSRDRADLEAFRNGTCDGCEWPRAGWRFAEDNATSGIGIRYQLVALPTIYVIDPDGVISHKHGGPESADELAAEIERARGR